MRTVTVRICAVEFSATIAAMSEWLHANQYEPTRYKYEEHEDAVLVTVDFAGEMEAEAFATRYDGICGSYPQWTLPEILPQSRKWPGVAPPTGPSAATLRPGAHSSGEPI